MRYNKGDILICSTDTMYGQKQQHLIEVDQESISYKDGNLIYILEFNKGYIYNGTSTRVKFDKYKEGERYQAFDQYAF